MEKLQRPPDAERFREFTTRPCEQAEVLIELDDTVEVRWPYEGLTVLLSPREAEDLGKRLVTVATVGSPTEAAG